MTSPQFIQTTQMHIDPGVIDLGVGQPQLELLPFERLRRAAARCFETNDAGFLQYGAEQGDGYLRQALARFLAQEYAFPVAPETLFITNGASSGLDLTCTLFTRPGDVIFVEEPTYFLALRIFADHHLRPVPVAVDEHGLVPEALAEALKTHRPALLYTIPSFQNPSGCTLSAERRQHLALLSREHGFLIVADEVYHLLYFNAAPPPAFASQAGVGNIVSLGSFSKILAPGLRLGWIQTDAARARAYAACGLLDSGGGLNPFTSAVVRGLVESGELKAHIAELCAVYRERVAAMHAALQTHLPGALYQVPQGGYFFWVRLPGGRDAAALAQRAGQFKVSFRPGMRFSIGGGLADFVRLCFACYPSEQLVEGVARLGRALE
jgi:DNA-binding transcriptional MocR family regulator